MANNFNLVLHCGGTTSDLDSLKRVRTPEPSGSHYPVAHHALLASIHGAIRRSNMSIVQESVGLNRDGAQAFGLIQVDWSDVLGQDIRGDDDGTTIVGWRNSHDKTFSAGLTGGYGVFVCDNLAFNGEVRLARKHTRFIERDLPGLTLRALGRLLESRVTNERRIERYKTTEVSESEANDMIVNALEAKVIGAQKVLPLVQEFRAPRHPEFVKDGHTLWTLHNAFTEILKDYSPHELPRRSTLLHGLLDTRCGFELPDVVGEAVDAEFTVAS